MICYNISKQTIIKKTSFIINQLKKCQRTRLVHYCRICIVRAFLQAVITFLITELIVLAYLSADIERELTSSEVGSVLCTPALVSIMIYILFVGMFIYNIIKLFCDIFTKLIDSKIRKASITEHNCEELFDRITLIQLKIDKKMQMIHFGGMVMYCLAGGAMGIYYMNYVHVNFDVVNTGIYPLALSLFGLICGGCWNICDYFAEKRIDWLYIISDTSLSELFSNPIFEDCKKLNVMIDDKKFYYVIHTFSLIVVSFLYIALVMTCKPLYSIVTFDLSFISNQYILFFVTWSVLFYKYSYSYYYKTEKVRRKIFPHFYDF